MIDVAIHGIKAKSALYSDGMDSLFFRFEADNREGRGTIFFSTREELRTFILALTEAEAIYFNREKETIHFNR